VKNEKVIKKRQTSRAVIVVDTKTPKPKSLRAYFASHPMPGLDEVLVVQYNSVVRIYP